MSDQQVNTGAQQHNTGAQQHNTGAQQHNTGAQQETLDKWAPVARATKDVTPTPVPHHILLEEAVAVARFFRAHWETQRDAQGRIAMPGLDLLAHNGRLTPELGEEILQLVAATHAAQTRYRLGLETPTAGVRKRAQQVLRRR